MEFMVYLLQSAVFSFFFCDATAIGENHPPAELTALVEKQSREDRVDTVIGRRKISTQEPSIAQRVQDALMNIYVKQIARGNKHGRNVEYSTMNDIESDWDSDQVKALDALEAKSVPREGDKALTADKNISMSTEYVEPGVSEETKPVIRGAVKRMTPAQVKYCTPEKNMKMTQIMKHFKSGNVEFKKAASPINIKQKKAKDIKSSPPVKTPEQNLEGAEEENVKANFNYPCKKQTIQHMLQEAAKKQMDKKQPILLISTEEQDI